MLSIGVSAAEEVSTRSLLLHDVDICFLECDIPSSWTHHQKEALKKLYYVVNNDPEITCTLEYNSQGYEFLQLYSSSPTIKYSRPSASGNVTSVGTLRNDSSYSIRICYGYLNGTLIGNFIVPANSSVDLTLFSADSNDLLNVGTSPSQTLTFYVDTSYAPAKPKVVFDLIAESIVSTVINSMSGFSTGTAGLIVNVFDEVFVNGTGDNATITNFGTYALVFLGITVTIGIIGAVVSKVG